MNFHKNNTVRTSCIMDTGLLMITVDRLERDLGAWGFMIINMCPRFVHVIASVSDPLYLSFFAIITCFSFLRLGVPSISECYT